MPFTVITLKKVPNSLRGDLTRWMQEIATGVYVGSYNSRVREYLWKRITDTVGNGEASICFSCRNEIGYSFCTYNTERQVVDSDGIPLVLIPANNSNEDEQKEKQHGFSAASKFHQANIKQRKNKFSLSEKATKDDEISPDLMKSIGAGEKEIVFLDIETTGLNADTDHIIEIGALKISRETMFEFHRLIRTEVHLPDVVSNMTGITNNMLLEGELLEDCIRDFATFIQGATLVGYNISFDIKFLNKALEYYSFAPIHNKTLELIHEAKKRNSFQVNYKFETTLKEYGINQEVPHRALEDAKLMYELYNRMGLEGE